MCLWVSKTNCEIDKHLNICSCRKGMLEDLVNMYDETEDTPETV